MPTATVTLPDGRQAEVTGPTRAAILNRVNALREETARVVKDQSLSEDVNQIRRGLQEGDVGDLETLGRSGVGRFLDAFFEAPEDILNFASEQAKNLPRIVRFSPFAGQMAGALQDAPPNVDIPNPESSDVFALAQMAGEGAGAVRTGDFQNLTSFQEAKRQQEALTEQGERENPLAAATGQALGDAATLATGRGRIAVARRNAQLRKAPKVQDIAPGAKQLAKDIFQSDRVKSLKRAAGKAAETSLEGATLAILNDGDPVEVAGWTAGGQLLGSLALETFPPTKRGLINFAAVTGSLAVILRFGQEFSPGQNNVWDAVDQSFAKMKYGLIAGVTASAVGAGRIGTAQDAGLIAKSFQKNAPAFTDAITSIPRGMVLSWTNELLKEGDDGKVSALEKMAKNPEAFNEAIRKRVERAAKNGTLQEEMDRLMKNKKFKETLDKL